MTILKSRVDGPTSHMSPTWIAPRIACVPTAAEDDSGSAALQRQESRQTLLGQTKYRRNKFGMHRVLGSRLIANINYVFVLAM